MSLKPTKPYSQFSNLEEIAAVYDAMPRVRVGVNDYSRQNRAQDFLSVFNGSEQGRRVLSQISDYCNPSPAQQQQLGPLAFNDGKRSVFGWIGVCMTTVSAPTVIREKPPTEAGG